LIRKTWWLRVLAFLVLAPVLSAAVFASHLYVTQESLLFPGTKLPDDYRFDFDLPFEEITIPVDGAELNALHFRQENPRGLVFFLHGNGGNLQSWTSNIRYYQQVNYDMFMLDYRGYGKSSGEIESEAQMHADVRAAWDRVAAEYDGKPIVIYGRSLGSAVATKLAADVDPALLILVSPFSSVVAMAKQEYPYLPASLVRYPFRTDELIGKVKSPIIFVHGTDDRLIPLSHSELLLERATAPSELLVIDGAGHSDIHRYESYTEGLTAALPGG
tara:strand:+ start:786 stop:1604 length:819 start_codon:yes stop_codon:yes gene_type:complete